MAEWTEGHKKEMLDAIMAAARSITADDVIVDPKKVVAYLERKPMEFAIGEVVWSKRGCQWVELADNIIDDADDFEKQSTAQSGAGELVETIKKAIKSDQWLGEIREMLTDALQKWHSDRGEDV